MQILIGAQCAYCRNSRMGSEFLGETAGWLCDPFPEGLPARYEQGLERCPYRRPRDADRWTGPIKKDLSGGSDQLAAMASAWAGGAIEAIAKDKGWVSGPNAQWRRRDEEKPRSSAKKCEEVPAEEFVGFRERSKYPAFLGDYDAAWYRANGARCYKLPGLDAGYALYPDPENGGKMTLISVHNNSDVSDLGRVLVEDAMANGAEALDCYAGHLVIFYSRLGFVKRDEKLWSDEFAPKDWDYNAHGRPNVVVMERAK